MLEAESGGLHVTRVVFDSAELLLGDEDIRISSEFMDGDMIRN